MKVEWKDSSIVQTPQPDTARVSDHTDGLCSIVIVQLVQHFNISSALS